MNPIAPDFVARLPAAIAALLAAAVLLAGVRLLWRFLRSAPPERPRGWRIATLLLVQVAGALLLYRMLFPPTARASAGWLVVATAGADRVPADKRPADAALIALPEAPPLRGAARAPDLASALRQHPGTTRIRVLGNGLAPRDLDAARGLAVDFRPAPLPQGLVALWPPQAVQAGRAFDVVGRVHGLPGGAVELLDPGGARVARSNLPSDGSFRLTGLAREPGPATWRLRTHDRQGKRVDDTPLPLDIAPGARLRVLVLAAAPTPELKYLRRWASDAGLVPDARIALGGGVEIGDASARLDAGTLAAYDLVVLDARSWQALGARQASLLRAVGDGLGLLLRCPDAISAGERADLRRLGFATTVGPARDVALPALAGNDDDAPDAKLARGPLRIADDGAVPLLRDVAGDPLAWWRTRGLGRIGVAGFDDSYRLVLAGDGARHGALWATLFTTLARPRAAAPAARLEGDVRVDERAVLCGLSPDAVVDSPDGRRIRLHVDPASGPRACAGLWPRVPGWHVLRIGNTAQRFHVRAADEAPGLRAAQLHDATARLAASTPPAPAQGHGPAVPGPRWPWFLAWLAVTAAGWWFERSRLGRAAPPAG